MAALQHFALKFQAYQIYLLLGWLTLLLALAIAMLARQKRIRKLEQLLLANFENLRSKMDESSAAVKKAQTESVAALQKQLQDLAGQLPGLTMQIGKLTGQVHEAQSGVQDGIQQLTADNQQNHGEAFAALQALGEQLETLADELAWTNHWFEDLKTLEQSVIDTIGPTKMLKLINKERKDIQAVGKELAQKSDS